MKLNLIIYRFMLPTELRFPFSKVIVQFVGVAAVQDTKLIIIPVSKIVTDTTFCKKTAPEATEEA